MAKSRFIFFASILESNIRSSDKSLRRETFLSEVSIIWLINSLVMEFLLCLYKSNDINKTVIGVLNS